MLYIHRSKKGVFFMLEQEHARQSSEGITTTVLEQPGIEALKASLRGELFQPGEEGYEAARTTYNAMIDRHPALIVRCAGVSDVITAVQFARSRNLLVAIRGGGHNVAGRAICDGGLVIDLSLMKGIHVDPAHRIARAEPGVTWSEFDRETQAFGLATTGGTVSSTGIAGLTLGGGIGWPMRTCGLACDNLVSVDLVTAQGRLLTASTTENPDLFWGMRGAGANFGVVTSFEYRLHPVGPVLGGMLIYPLSKARDALRFYRDVTATAPDELTALAALLTSPDGVPVVAIAPFYNGPIEVGEEVMQPLRAFGPPLADHVGPMNYLQVQTMLDAMMPAGLRNYWKTNFLKELSDEAIDTLVTSFATVPSALTAAVIEQFGGAVGRIGEDETAFSPRDQRFNLVIASRWTNPAESEKHRQWTRDLWDVMQPFATDAVYVNYLPEDEDDRVKALYGAAKYERLVRLKNTYDPANFFQLNANIKPTV
jgi:hypothetical protein